MLQLVVALSFAACVVSQQQILPQCQCIPDSSGKGCLQYDSRYQAATLDEAMIAFPDLSDEKPASAPDTPIEVQAACVTQECRDCQNDLKKKLKKIGLIPTAVNEALIAQGNSTSTCKKYKFSRGEEGVYDDDTKSKKDDDSSESSESEEKKKSSEKRHRDRRQAAIDPNTLGQSFTLSCSAKGVAVDSTGMVSLCSSCWVWRKLPDNYEPMFINELVCDTSDNACLSGYATCSVGHRSVDVIRNDTGVRTTVTLTAGSFCECKVTKGSALQSLVSDAGLNTALPPIANAPAPAI